MIKDKRWSKELEKTLLKKWKHEKIYITPGKPKGNRYFTIDTPPPYPSGRPWHIGAAGHYSKIDMIARTARLMGKSVLFPIGIDRNGLPVETYTEKLHNISLHDVTREKFVELCNRSLDDLENEMVGILKSMGFSADFENHYYRTDSPEYRTLTQATFIELWNKDMVYVDTRPTNYDTKLRTTVADAEIEYRDVNSKLIHVKWKVKEGGEIVIATTRPELLCSCQVVMVNPGDKRHKKLVGKHAVIPLYNRDVKIIAHPYASIDFGTGIVMMCSYGDYNDVRVFRELKLPEIIAITPDGSMTKAAGDYRGMKVADAREKILEDLKAKGYVKKIESINHRSPYSERGKVPIEIIPMEEFYVRQMELKDKVWEMSKKIKFHPETNRIILKNWIGSITIDWPVSRNRYYGTEIPIWYCNRCKRACLPKPGKYYQPWKEEPPFKKCQHCGESGGFTGEMRTFDTWMDSSISPLFISKFKNNESLFKKSYPSGIRPQGKDIVRTWLYYTLLRCYHLTKKIPWEHAWVDGYCVDEKGEKMSKSKGNIIDPIPILDRYGADSFRFWAASESSLGSDFRASEEKVENASKFMTKLWNVARFISSFEQVKGKPKLTVLDRWILSELEKTRKRCMEGYKEFNFFIPANTIKDFVWNIFAPHYLEMVKVRVYGKGKDRDAALYTLHRCLKSIVQLLCPVNPFITDHIHRELYGKSVHKEGFPESEREDRFKFKTEDLIEINSRVWKKKKDKGLSLKSPVKSLTVNRKFKDIEKDLKETHGVEKLKYGSKFAISL
jgi:valyl-tRNA synthetase